MVAAPPNARPGAMSLLRQRPPLRSPPTTAPASCGTRFNSGIWRIVWRAPAENGARECAEEKQKWPSRSEPPKA
jgi:hypothetical protein